MKDIIQLLKDNGFPFGMWPEPKCYGEGLGMEMQGKAREINGEGVFLIWMRYKWCERTRETFEGDYAYCLRPDYEEKPEIVEVMIRKLNSDLVYEYGGSGKLYLDMAFRDPDFIGFKFEDGTVFDQSIKYSVPGITSKGYYTHYNDLKAGQSLEHHATHVLFRRQQ